MFNAVAKDWTQALPQIFGNGIGDADCIPDAGRSVMANFSQGARILFFVAVTCCSQVQAYAHQIGASAASPAYAGEKPADDAATVASPNEFEIRHLPQVSLLTPSQKDHGRKDTMISSEPFGRQLQLLATPPSEVLAKWVDLQSRIHSEEETLAACRANDGACPAAARRFLDIVELGRRRQGRARLGEINRAVNLSIVPLSDWNQYGVEDFWSAPLATLDAEAGDCEDYAIVKYVALREAGIIPDDLRLVIVRDIKRKTNHAVVSVRHNEEWLILDNETLIMANAEEARHYDPLFILDHTGARAFATASLRR